LIGTIGLVGCLLGLSGCSTSGTSTTAPPPGSPLATVSPTSLTFASTTTGDSSAAQSVTVTNTGTASLAIAGITQAGDFSQSANTCTATLAIGASCQVSVLFTPTAVGARTGTLTLASNSSGGSVSVALSGTGTAPVVYTGAGFNLSALSGTKAIAGASVQIYAAGSTGNGSTPTALLASAATTDANGKVAIPAKYNCPAANAPVYAVSRGGNVGSAPGANANAVLMSAIGTCGSITSATNVVVNEVTTVAAMYALSQFYAPGGAIGASSTNLVGLTNAFATAASLADSSKGTAPGVTLPANATSPAARINSVANILNVCVASSSACGTLYSATTVTTAPANTLDALLNLVRNPGANTATLYGQSLLSTAYAPALTVQPSDFTMFLTLSGGGMNNTSGIAVDSTGSVWVASYFSVATKFTPVGAAVFPGGITGAALNNSYGLAIDLNDNAWIPNEQPSSSAGIGSVTELSSAGTAISGSTGYVNGGMNYPISVAIDPNGTVWVVDYGNSHVTLLNSLGAPLSGTSGYTTPLFAFPVAVVVDGNHFGWIANQSGNTVTKVSPTGTAFTNYDCCNGASGLAIDQGNNVWVANFYGDSVSLISSTGTVVSKAGFTGSGSMSRPQGIAIDGSGNVWVANYRQPYLTELAGASAATVGQSLSPATGLGADAKLLEAYALCVDASGNIWVSNQGNSTVTKFIGLAAPVKTPLSATPKAP
jgi:streptogramin lyase